MNKNHMLIAMDIEKYLRALKSIYDKKSQQSGYTANTLQHDRDHLCQAHS